MKVERLADLIESERYKKTLEEISTTIDNSIQEIGFVEPQLVSFIDDSVALQLLEKEAAANTKKFTEVHQIYQQIIEDVLLSLLELSPLEAKRVEAMGKLTNSTLSKLLEKYETFEKEEAGVVAKYRDQLKREIDDTVTLQNAVYEIEASNRRLKKELKTLNLQLNRTSKELEDEQNATVEEFDPNDKRLQQAKNMEQQLKEVNEQIAKGEEFREQLSAECVSIQQEIEALTEELVARNKRSARHVRKQRK